jgi:glycerol-3-phosphate dehydrogenase (NAD(P)+)
MSTKIGLVGAGSWGTTLANMLADKGFLINLWVFEEELFQILRKKHCNSYYLPGVNLNPSIVYTQSIDEAVRDKEIVIWACPSQKFRELFWYAFTYFNADTTHVNVSKGIENETLKCISQIAAEKSTLFDTKKFVSLSGPSFAVEVSKKLPTAVVVASRDRNAVSKVQEIMSTPYFRTYSSEDIIGVELGGALKNVIAIASGVADGLGYGYNTRAALITRGLAEMLRLGVYMGAEPLTFSGLSGMGDLVLTCTNTMSRNYSVGLKIAQGKTLNEILKEMKMIAEGIYTVRSAFSLSQKHQIEMPITCEVYHLLYQGKAATQAVKDLMSRSLKSEIS